MILKQPPREWIGTFRFVHLLNLKDCKAYYFSEITRKLKFYYSYSSSFSCRHLRQLGLVASDTGSLLKVGLGLAIAAIGGIYFVRLIRSSQS